MNIISEYWLLIVPAIFAVYWALAWLAKFKGLTFGNERPLA